MLAEKSSKFNSYFKNILLVMDWKNHQSSTYKLDGPPQFVKQSDTKKK